MRNYLNEIFEKNEWMVDYNKNSKCVASHAWQIFSYYIERIDEGAPRIETRDTGLFPGESNWKNHIE